MVFSCAQKGRGFSYCFRSKRTEISESPPFSLVKVIQSYLCHYSSQDSFTLVDLHDAYFLVHVSPEHRSLLRFTFMRQVDLFKVLPFKLSVAQQMFCKQASLSHPEVAKVHTFFT